MPIWEYLCLKCGHPFEKLVKSINGDEQKVKCPDCGSKEVQKQISICNFSLKGGGWAADGYQKGSNGK